jgi:NADPH:quinone reductase-like Zn-dependent oxidoreductase
MKAIRIHQYGGPDVLQIDEIPIPEIRDTDVLVKIKTAALNHLDLFIREGIPGIKFPLIVGSDGAGVIVEKGKKVDKLNPVKVGAEVIIVPYRIPAGHTSRDDDQDELSDYYMICGEHIDGTFAEYIALPADYVLPKPGSLTWEEAAAYPLSYMTSYHMLMKKIKIKKNDWILVWGASSGIGSAAVQIAKYRDATVIATAGTPDKEQFAYHLGSDFVINYRSDDVSTRVREITEGIGVHYVFEHIGRESWPHSLRSLRKGGAIVSCGATSGPIVQIDLRHLFIKHQRIIGSTMGNRTDLNELAHLFENGAFKPVVDSVFPFEKIREAHERMERGDHMGKIVLSF